MTGVEDFFIYWSGSHNLGPGEPFQQNYRLGKPPGHISPGFLLQGIFIAINSMQDGPFRGWSRIRAGNTGGGGKGVIPSPTFLRRKKIKWKQMRKRKSFC